MATLTCWIRNTETGEITEHEYVNQFPFLIGKQEFVKEADYLAYKEVTFSDGDDGLLTCSVCRDRYTTSPSGVCDHCRHQAWLDANA